MARSIEHLLEKLQQGDRAAAEQAFLEYEPYLRMVVRRQLSPRQRVKFESLDVVQSVWADLLGKFGSAGWSFSDADHLRAFLVRVTRNRFIDRARQERAAVNHERPLDQTEAGQMAIAREPRPSEVARADELWQQMLDLCPPAHHQILLLKKQGAGLNEIAAATGLHPSSVRRILYELADKLAGRGLTGNESSE